MWSFLQLVLGSYLGPASRTIFALLGALVFSAYIVLDTENLIARWEVFLRFLIVSSGWQTECSTASCGPTGCACVQWHCVSSSYGSIMPSLELQSFHLAIVSSVVLTVRLLACRHDLDDYVAASLSLYLVRTLHSLYFSPILCDLWVVEHQPEPFKALQIWP